MADILKLAAGLISDGDNPEYDRGIVELTCDVLEMPHSERDAVEDLIRAVVV